MSMESLGAVLLALVGFVSSASQCRATVFASGEILVNVNNNIERYSPSGTLLQTYTGTGFAWIGAALTPDGNLVTDYRNDPFGVPNPGVNIFSPDGTQIASFGVTGGSGVFSDISVFANGTLAVNDQNGSAVRFYDQTGALLQTVNLPGVLNPWGNTVGSDGILYIAGFNSNNLAKVDASGSLLGLIGLSFKPDDLVMNPADNTLWVTANDTGLVMHVNTAGAVLGSFSTGYEPLLFSGLNLGIGLAPDGNSLYVSHGLSSEVKRFDLSGNFLDSFTRPTSSGSFFITVAIPEPSRAMLMLGGLSALLLLRRGRLTIA